MFATSNKKHYAYDIHIIWFSVHVLRKHHEPIHVHVIKGDVSAKFTLFPVLEFGVGVVDVQCRK